MKWVLGIVSLLVVAVMAAGIYVYLNLGSLVKQGIETYAPPILGATVDVDSVKLLPTTGEGSISGFSIGNPSGYAAGSAISIGDFELIIDPESVTTDTIVIRKILIDRPALNYVQQDANNSNFSKLLANIQGGSTSDTSSDSASSNVKLIIDSFGIHNAVVTAASPLLPEETLDIPLPNIDLSGLGRSSGGAPPEVIAEEVAAQLLDAAKKALLNSDIYKQQVKQVIDNKLAEEKARLKEKTKAKQREIEDDAKQKLEEKLGDKADLIKGLFK